MTLSPKPLVKFVGRNVRDAMLLCGVGPKLDEDDRRLLDQKVFPYLLDRDEFEHILFVGCHWYTWHYNRTFADKDYWTLEIDPARKRYGSKKHIIDSAANVAQHFEPDSLDVVMFFGVIGWGLDDLDVAEQCFEGFFQTLRPGGLLIIGWDDVPEHRPFRLEDSTQLKRFDPFIFPPLDTQRYLTEGDLHHTFDFYRKPMNS